MTKLEAETVTALKTLFDTVDKLQKVNIRDVLSLRYASTTSKRSKQHMTY